MSVTESTFSGHLRLRAAARADGRTILADQSFRAPYHISKPYWDADAGTLLVQVVNPTAGILAGDRLESEIAADTNATLLVTTPSASRLFTMADGQAECTQRFRVAAGAWLEVSPEPLVPHRNCRFRQTTNLVVEPGGTAFFVDQLFPGRIGHGETWSWAELCLMLDVTVGDDLILRERFSHSANELKQLAAFSGSGPNACFANAVLIGDMGQSAQCLDRLRALHGNGVWLGVSNLRQSGWSIKIVAPDPIALRETLREARHVLAAAFPRLRCGTRKQ